MNTDNIYSVLVFFEGMFAGMLVIRLADWLSAGLRRYMQQRNTRRLAVAHSERIRAAERLLSSLDNTVRDAQRVRAETERVKRNVEALLNRQ